MSIKLTKPSPETALELVEDWSRIPGDVRKRRAAEASQNGDRETLRGLLEAYVLLHGRRGTDTSANTLKTYWRGAGRFLDWCESAGVKPHQVGEQGARRFLASLAELSAKTRQVYLTGAKTLVDALRWAGMGSGDPFETVRVTDLTSRVDKADPYNVDELQRLLEAGDDRERALVLLAADAGLRLAEATSLTWDQVDFERARIAVKGKGGKVARVGATDRLLDALGELERVGNRVIGVSRRRIQQLFDRLCERAEVKGRGYHNLRHSCGTRFYEQTRDLALVKRHLRHSSARTTEIYVHLAEGDYEEAIHALEGNGVG